MVELGEPPLWESPCRLGGVCTAEASLQRDEPAVGLLADRVDLDGVVDHFARRLVQVGLRV